jgi:hypothetical protein
VLFVYALEDWLERAWQVGPPGGACGDTHVCTVAAPAAMGASACGCLRRSLFLSAPGVGVLGLVRTLGFLVPFYEIEGFLTRFDIRVVGLALL